MADKKPRRSERGPVAPREMVVRRLLDVLGPSLDFRLLAGERGLSNPVTSWHLNRPGLAFAGFCQQFYAERIQILGGNEMAYLESLSQRKRTEAIRRVIDLKPPCFILTTAFKPPDGLIEECDARHMPLLATPHRTSLFASKLTTALMHEFAPTMTMPGTLVDVFGNGVLITGRSGAGKSECSLDLIARGHRFVGDDVVILKRITADKLLGRGSEVLAYHMEIHGVGIIDIEALYGIAAVTPEMEIDLRVHLETKDPNKDYERLGIEEHFSTILGVSVPEYVLPVEPGRSLSILIEAASLSQKMKDAGVNVAAQFNERLIRRMRATVPSDLATAMEARGLISPPSSDAEQTAPVLNSPRKAPKRTTKKAAKKKA